jgi:tetratricopeptide (TPR) repeat protein
MPLPLNRALPLVLVSLFALAVVALQGPVSAGKTSAFQEDPLFVTSSTVYDITDEGLVRVAIDVSVENHDPTTEDHDRPGEPFFFYDSVTLPALRGAGSVTAISDGETLNVNLDESGRGVAIGVTVQFHERLFYQQTYDFTLNYELEEVREPSFLVTPFYVFLPAIAGGHEATVTVTMPASQGWETSLEAADCPGNGGVFTCAGDGTTHLAALAEVTRPDAVATTFFEAPLSETVLAVNLTYLVTEDDAARHLQELIIRGLPVLEELHGFPYDGPPVLNVAHGGRQLILGYEGLTECHPGEACNIVVSPVAYDITVLHELAHLWHHIYANRWLAEGFAEFMAQEAESLLPPDVVRGERPLRQPVAVDLPLDLWGEVTSVIGAADERMAIEAAGYEYSLRFIQVLRSELGLDTLQRVNRAIWESGRPADSRMFMDLIEEISGRNVDELFRTWVFPDSFWPVLEVRREARDRMDQLRMAARDYGMPEEQLSAVADLISDWRFDEALGLLDLAEANLETYVALESRLASLERRAQDTGLIFPSEMVAEAISAWDFDAAQRLMNDGELALELYARAHERVNEPRSLWQQFGLLGRSPDRDLAAAASAFAAGDFLAAMEHSDRAIDAISGASGAALFRLLVVVVIMAVISGVAALAMWLSHVSRRRLAEE